MFLAPLSDMKLEQSINLIRCSILTLVTRKNYDCENQIGFTLVLMIVSPFKNLERVISSGAWRSCHLEKSVISDV